MSFDAVIMYTLHTTIFRFACQGFYCFTMVCDLKNDSRFSCCTLTLVAMFTRFYSLVTPSYVCWDEVHFGKMAGHYINHTFFFDVHPPLGKLIFSGVGYAFGYNGKFAFSNTGDEYQSNSSELAVPYVQMRSVSALCGTLLIPTAYHLILALTNNKTSAFISSSLLTFDVGLITLSQYILLDPILILFVVGAVMCCAKLKACQEETSFSMSWWLWLLSCGINLGLAISIKLVGALTILFVGCSTLHDLTNVWLKDRNVKIFLIHFLARVASLIFLPLMIYVFTFWLHFNILKNTGRASDLFTARFQASLIGNPFYNSTMPERVHSKNFITIRGWGYGGAILHSHDRSYPNSVHPHHLQQVTGYLAKDTNNLWNILGFVENGQDDFIKHGDQVQLIHVKTKAKLAVALNDRNHWSVAPMSTGQLLVTAVQNSNKYIAYGSDRWKVKMRGQDERLRPIVSFFQIQNVATRCNLNLGDRSLPKWGWKQKEVTCAKQNFSGTWWVVENVVAKTSVIEKLPIPAMTFYEKVLELHGVMLVMNSRLTPKTGDSWSQPYQWPFLNEGQLFSRESNKVHLYGTPLIWWMNIFSLLLFLIIGSLVLFSPKSCCGTLRSVKELNACGWLMLAWFIHYAPFFVMKRVLFFHHYFPAHVFATCLCGVFLSILCQTFAQVCSPLMLIDASLFHKSLLVLLTALTVASFYMYVDICYGV